MQHLLYNGDVKITFTESNHSYWLEDENGKKKRLCGVTTMLSVLDKPALIPWAVGVTVDYIRKNLDRLSEEPSVLLREAKDESNKVRDLSAEIGSAIHNWIEQHIKGEQPEMPTDDRVLIGVNSFLEWVDEFKVEFKHSELLVYSKKYNYVGTLDIIATINGEDYLLDIKTGNALYAEVKLQTSAYKRAYEEESGNKLKGRWALRISKETEDEYKIKMEKKGRDASGYKVFEAKYLGDDDDADFECFLSCLNIYRWKSEANKDF